MSTNNVALSVRILGRDYTVACPRGEEQALLDSANRVDEEMRRVHASGNVLGADRIAVMVSLNLAHELLLLQQRTDPIHQNHASPSAEPELQTQVQRLQDQVEAALNSFHDSQKFSAG